MSIFNDLKELIVGSDRKLDDLKETVEASLETPKEVADLNLENSNLKASITNLKATIQEHEDERAHLKMEIDSLKATIDSPDGEIQKRASAKAAEIVASTGAPPIKTKSTEPNEKPDFSALHGLEKVTAIMQWKEKQALKA